MASSLRPSYALLFVLVGCTARGTHDPAEQQAAAAETDEGAPTAVVVDGDAKLHWTRANACGDASPVELTASDGTGLKLRTLRAKAVVDGPLAFTELHLRFHNPQPRQLEGRFSIQLPPDAAISRMAMKIGDRWQEGEVVERQAARVAYEDFLHRRQDPALLENDAGNVFRARVFPIPASADKDIIISYSQEIENRREPFRLPICGLPKLGELDVDVIVAVGDAAIDSSLGGRGRNVQHLELSRRDFTPTMDLELRTGQIRSDVGGIRNGDLVIARVAPVLDTAPQPVERLTILFDTSASRAIDFDGQVQRLGRLVAELARRSPNMHLDLLAVDQTVEPIHSGPAVDLGDAQLQALRDRGALGATDLASALRGLLLRSTRSPRVLVVGDGIPTAGDTDAAEISEIARALGEAGVVRIDALIDGGAADDELLHTLVTAGPHDDGVVVDARVELSDIADKLTKATRSDIAVHVPDAEWVWPSKLDGVQPGDERLVFAQLPDERVFEIELQGAGIETSQPVLTEASPSLVHRAHARARIESLQQQLDALDSGSEQRQPLIDEIVALSTRHRVLSDFTALLVLETENDYRRFGIERRALADIMTVGATGIEHVQRTWPEATTTRDFQKSTGAKKKLANKALDDADKGGEVALEEEEGRPDDFVPTTVDAVPAAEPEPDAIADEEKADDLRGPRVFGGDPGAADGEAPTTRSADIPPAPPPRPEPALEAERTRSRRSTRGGAREDTETATGRPPREQPAIAQPYTGRFATVMRELDEGRIHLAAGEAEAWRAEAPGDVLALVALGEVREAVGDRHGAARAYGSLVDLFPSRADIRRMAGERLERLQVDGMSLAIDTYRKAVEQRPDHPSGHRLLAFALLQAGRPWEALEVLAAALDRTYPDGRFAGVDQVLASDLGLVAAAVVAADPTRAPDVERILAEHRVPRARTPSLRFVLTWETDANDVDLHVYDALGSHAFYGHRDLASGGHLIADVTTGYGPEGFVIDRKPKAFPYTLQANYYRRGPMGYGMGVLHVVEHDGEGHVSSSAHPFVIMVDGGFVDLAKVEAPLH